MAVNTFSGTGKASETAKWSKGALPKASEDVVIAEKAKCEINSEIVCLSLRVLKEGEVSGVTPFSVGSTTEPEAGTKGFGLKLETGAVWKYTGTIALTSTFAGTVKLTTNGISLGGTGLSTNNKSSKYLLESALTTTSNLELGEEGVFNTNGMTLTVSRLVAKGTNKKTELICGASEIVITGSSAVTKVFDLGSEGKISAGTSTLVFTGEKVKMSGRGLTYNNVTIESKEWEVTFANTWATMKLNKAGQTIKLEKSETQTVTNLEVIGSKEGELTTLESNEAGKQAKLKCNGAITVKNLKLLQVKAEGTEPTDEYEGEESTYKGAGVEGWHFTKTGGATPAVITLAAAKSDSSATGALQAMTQIALNAALSTSAATGALQAKTQIALNAALSESSATGALAARTQIALNPALSTSAATGALQARIQIVLSPAASESSATGALQARTQIVLNPALGESAASATVEILVVRVVIPLNPALSESKATARVTATTQVALSPALSTSAAKGALSAATQIALAPASSTSSASLALSVGAAAEASFAEGGTQAGLGARGGASGGTSATGGLTGGLHYAGASAAATAGAGGSIGGVIGTGGTP